MITLEKEHAVQFDSNRIMRRAEHEISYRAKRAAELFLILKRDQAKDVPRSFAEAARRHGLCEGENEKLWEILWEEGVVSG